MGSNPHRIPVKIKMKKIKIIVTNLFQIAQRRPWTTGAKKRKGDNTSPENTEGNGPSSAPAGDSAKTTPLPSNGGSNPTDASHVQNLLMNKCASPWSELYVPSIINFAGGVSTSPLSFKWTLRADPTSSTNKIDWLAPGVGSYLIRKNNSGNTSFSVEITDQAQGASTIGANVLCSQIQVSTGEFLGTQQGPLEEVSANLSLNSSLATIKWYTAKNGNEKSLKLIRILMIPSNVIYDFKPQ